MRLLRRTLVVLLAAPAWAGDPESLADLIPPEAPAYLEVRVPTEAENRKQATFRCFEEPSLKRVLDRMASDENSFTSMSMGLGKGRLVVQTDIRQPSFLLKVRYLDEKVGERLIRLQNRFALAWVGIQEGPIPPDLVVALEIESGAAASVDTIQRIVAAISLHAREETRRSIEAEIQEIFSDEAYRERRYVRARIEGVPLFLVPIGKLLLVATSEARVKDMIDRALEGGRPSYSADERHRAILASCAGDGTVTGVIAIHVDRAIAALSGRFPGAAAMAQASLQQVGLAGLRGFSTVTRADGAGLSSITSVLLEGERAGLGRLFAGGAPVPFDGLSFAPKDSYYATCGRFNPGELYQATLEVGGMIVAMGASSFQQKTGVRLKEDLIDLAGPDVTLVVAPSRGVLPDIGIVLGSPDPARLEQALLRVLAVQDWPPGTGVQSVEIGGAKASVIPLGHPRLGGAPLAPTFGVVGGKLLVTPFPLSFQHFVAVKNGEYESLASNRDFAALRQRVPPEALSVSYTDLPRLVSLFYDTFMPLMQAMSSMGPQATTIYELPDARIFERHLFGRVGWTTCDGRGFHWHSHSSMDMTGFLLGAVAGGAGAFMLVTQPQAQVVEAPLPVKAEPAGEVDREARLCAARVRLLRGGLRLYRAQHGSLPDSLEALHEGQVAAENFVVPGTDKGYVYLGPAGQGTVLMHGHPNGKDRRICVVTTGLEIRRVSEADLEAMLRSESSPEGR